MLGKEQVMRRFLVTLAAGVFCATALSGVRASSVSVSASGALSDRGEYSPFVLLTPPDFLQPDAGTSLTAKVPFPSSHSLTKSLRVENTFAQPFHLDVEAASINSKTVRTARATISDSVIEIGDLTQTGFARLFPNSSSTATFKINWKMQLTDLVGSKITGAHSGTVTNLFHLTADAGPKDAKPSAQDGAFVIQNGNRKSTFLSDLKSAGGFFADKTGKIERNTLASFDVPLTVTVKKGDIGKRSDGSSLGDPNLLLIYFNGFAETDVKATGSLRLADVLDKKGKVPPSNVTNGVFKLDLPSEITSYSVNGKSLGTSALQATQLPTIPLPPAVWTGLSTLAILAAAGALKSRRAARLAGH
jgi:hypothetical protein